MRCAGTRTRLDPSAALLVALDLQAAERFADRFVWIFGWGLEKDSDVPEISSILETAGKHRLNGAVVSFGLDTLCKKSPEYFKRLDQIKKSCDNNHLELIPSVFSVGYGGGALALALGGTAPKWADKILHPPSRLTKIGVRPEWRAVVLGEVHDDFIQELRDAVDTVFVGRLLKDVDAIFVGVSRPSDFKRLSRIKASMKPTGAVWLIRPKGSTSVTEGTVRSAGKAAGLVDVKVVAFSATHSALKFVIPVKDRVR
jgi:hypothetical protein